MHWNRMLYTLPEYQEKLRNGYHKLGLLCQNKKDSKIYIFRPVPSTAWLPEGRKKYFAKLYNRSKNLTYNKKYSFCTLTYSTRLYTSVQAAHRVKADIDKFFKRLNYRKSKPEYFYVIELTKKYMVHVHIIFQGYVHRKKIFKSWFKTTGCIAVKIQHIPFQKALFYCLKYLRKSKKQDESKWGFLFSHVSRLWTCSRKFFEPIISKDSEWFVHAFFRDPGVFTYPFFEKYMEESKSRELTKCEFHNLLHTLIFSDDLFLRNNSEDFPSHNPRRLSTGKPIDYITSKSGIRVCINI